MEIWKPVVGFESEYHVSNLGRLMTVKQGSGARYGRILKPGYSQKGYVQYTLGKYGGRHSAHLLVMQAFFGSKPDGMEINHINGIKDDNRLENLEYCTKSQNKLHATKFLNKGRGESHGNSKITDEIVREIRRLGHTGLSHREIAARFNITRTNVSYILKGDAWSHVI
jgi:hypothetical protein